MDVMKLGENSNFVTGIISRVITKAIRKKTGCDVDVTLNEVDATNIEGKTHVRIDVEADIEKEDLLKILKTIGL